MRILLTQRELSTIGGTQFFTAEVANELARRGHEVAVYSPILGEIADLMPASGVRVRARLGQIPWRPDLIHGQHHLTAMAALAHFPGTPAIYHCHGVGPWVEQPPSCPRIATYVVMCEWMAPRLRAQMGLAAERVVAVPNFVNTRRFSVVRAPPPVPRRALLFGHGGFAEAELARLERACRTNGLSLDKIGRPYGNPRPRPEVFLQDYDLVFAIGKCALEALACGCAVIPILPEQAGSLITEATVPDWAHSNFSPRYYVSAQQIDEAWLSRELGAYAPDGVLAASAAIRGRFTLTATVDRLEALYRDVLAQGAPAAASSAELAEYLEAIAPEVDAMWAESQSRARERQELAQLRRELETARETIALLHERAIRAFPEVDRHLERAARGARPRLLRRLRRRLRAWLGARGWMFTQRSP